MRSMLAFFLALFMLSSTVAQAAQKANIANTPAEELGQLKVKAEHGDAWSQEWLGELYNNSSNSVEAMKWWRKAADQGHAYAEREIGDQYENGWGAVSQDYVEAYYWYSLAAKVKPYYTSIRDNGAKHITAEQKAAIDERVAEWKPTSASSQTSPPTSSSGYENTGTDISLDRPNMDTAAIVSWTAITVSDLMTFGADDYPEHFSKAARHFTKQGWDVFASAFRHFGILETVVSNKMSLRAEPEMSPVLIQEGVLAGKWRWVVTTPLTVHYGRAQSDHEEVLQIAVVIERAAVTENNTDGLAITEFIITITPAPQHAVAAVPANGSSSIAIPDYPPALAAPAPARQRFQPDAALDTPNMDDDQVTAWAAAAATRAATFGFTNLDEAFTKAETDFTSDGWKTFQSALNGSNLLSEMVEHKLILTSAPVSIPVVLHKGLHDGRYQWTVKLTLVQTERKDCSKSIQQLPVTLTLVRTTVAQNQPGVAIAEWDGNIPPPDFSSSHPCYSSPSKITY